MRRHGVDENLWTNILGGEAAIWSEQTSEDDVLSKVNYEARDLQHASELFTGYLTEFCDEYDRCGYG